MKTNKILIAFFFLPILQSCASTDTGSKVTPITRWFLAVRERVHPPVWHEPSDSLETIAKHWQAVVQEDMKMAWHYANRPDKIEDSTVIELTGEYVKSDTLAELFAYHCARLDTAQNSSENFDIDFGRQFASNPDADYFKHKPISTHYADVHRTELEALRTALMLHRQVQSLAQSDGRSTDFRYGMR
ncbi:MAG TPA: hypothetical protein VGM92_06405 [Candidatus Kapabacteria bacterium]|jgi:hypothetical protein